MESATIGLRARRPDSIEIGLIGALLALAAIGWVVTGGQMAGMDAGPGTDPGGLGFFVLTWAVMMAAMMFPSIWPMVLIHARMQRTKRERGRESQAGATALFVCGYLVIWSAAGFAAYAIFQGVQSLSIDALSWSRGGPYLAGAVIVGAAIYQLTPLKDACLRKCRSPVSFMVTSWRPGRLGAFRMGIGHGAWCLGCCWALMAALFAVGVMSIGWMAFIAALIAIEKLLPWKALANRGIAIILLVLGLGVAFSAENVPGLTLPDSPKAARAMQMMDGGAMKDDSMKGGSMKGGPMKHDSMKDRSMKKHSMPSSP